MKSYGGWAMLSLLLGTLVIAPSMAQDTVPKAPKITEEGDYVTIQFAPEGLPFEDFVVAVSNLTNRQFVFDAQKTRNKTIKLIGTKRIHKDDLFTFFQTLFTTQELAIVPLGPPEAEVLLIEDIRTSQFLKQRARFVDFENVEKFSRFVGELITTTVPLSHIPVEKAQRALSQITAENRFGYVVPIEESNSLLVSNFAPTVYQICRIIRAIDVEVEENRLIFEKLALEYHIAEELAPIVDRLIETRTSIQASGGTSRPSGGRSGSSARVSSGSAPPTPVIEPDPRTNSLLVYAIEEYMLEIKMLVASLDSEVTEPQSNIHIYELKNTNADEIQQVLSELLSNTQGRGARASGAGGTRSTRTSSTRTGSALSANASDQDYVNIVADPNTNSLLFDSTRKRFEEIREIVAKLDKRRPQVLVQTAIVELSDSDLQQIGVELAQVEGGGEEVRLFGGTAFGLSSITTQSELNSGGDTGSGTGTGTGGGTGTTTSTTSSNFFDDLVRIPNLDAQGLVGGIFSNFIEVPILVQMFKQVTKGNLVSVPSILVNDNHESHIKVGTEIPTTTVNQGQFSDQSSFGGYQKAELELRISPHISNDDYLRLDIFLLVEAFTGAQVDPSIPPPKTTREIQTNITVQSGKTIVIGGLITDNQRETVVGVPFFSSIPIVGELFKNRGTNDEKTTLYVFLTPTILSEFEALERLSYERKLEIAKMDGQIQMIDPNFRPIELDDKDVSIEEIESTGTLDLPRYRISTTIQPDPRDASGVPVKPGNGSKKKDQDKPETDETRGKGDARPKPVGSKSGG